MSGAAHQTHRLMAKADAVLLKIRPATADQRETVARLLHGQPDADLLAQMLGLAPYQSGRRRRNHSTEYRLRKGRPVLTHNANGYKAGCRCGTCRGAMIEHRRVYRPPIRQHGTETAYKNGGCRCADCRAAASEAARRRKQVA